jgi:CheY-specific phosphatase CheX
MNEHLQQAAVQAIGNVFETMFFVFLEPLDPDTEAWRAGMAAAGPLWLQCRIGFAGRINGRLGLLMPLTLARELATNFLGLESEASETQAEDMVQELTNMVCGNLFSLFDRQGVYQLTMPRAERVAEASSHFTGRSSGLPPMDFLAEDRLIRLEIETGEGN